MKLLQFFKDSIGVEVMYNKPEDKFYVEGKACEYFSNSFGEIVVKLNEKQTVKLIELLDVVQYGKLQDWRPLIHNGEIYSDYLISEHDELRKINSHLVCKLNK